MSDVVHRPDPEVGQVWRNRGAPHGMVLVADTSNGFVMLNSGGLHYRESVGDFLVHYDFVAPSPSQAALDEDRRMAARQDAIEDGDM